MIAATSDTDIAFIVHITLKAVMEDSR